MLFGSRVLDFLSLWVSRVGFLSLWVSRVVFWGTGRCVVAYEGHNFFRFQCLFKSGDDFVGLAALRPAGPAMGMACCVSVLSVWGVFFARAELSQVPWHCLGQLPN